MKLGVNRSRQYANHPLGLCPHYVAGLGRQVAVGYCPPEVVLVFQPPAAVRGDDEVQDEIHGVKTAVSVTGL